MGSRPGARSGAPGTSAGVRTARVRARFRIVSAVNRNSLRRRISTELALAPHNCYYCCHAEIPTQRSRLWLDHRRQAAPNPGEERKPGGGLRRKRRRAQERENPRPQERRCPRPRHPAKGFAERPLRLNPQPVLLNREAELGREDGLTPPLGPQRPPPRGQAHLANRTRRSARRAEVVRRGCAGRRTQTSVPTSPIQSPTRWLWGRKSWPGRFKREVRLSRLPPTWRRVLLGPQRR